MILYADVIVDLQAGDTGKGKVAHHLAKLSNEYTHVVRYNGGGNAGHTIYHNGEKFVTHYIPVGVIYGIKSIIGPGCVVNVEGLFKEIEELEKGGFDVRSNLFIDKRTHVITDEHLNEENGETKIGTTKKGNGPAYRDKYSRKGVRAESVKELKSFLIDIYEEFHENEDKVKVLFEGAQGFELDIDWGDYPYVTSSHCTVGGAILNGMPPNKIRRVYGVAKAYRTYVGSKQFEPDNPIFSKIREIGNEFGATTGRPRQINWLDLDLLIKSCKINGVTNIVLNKLDVLEEVGEYHLYENGELTSFENSQKFQIYIETTLRKRINTHMNIRWSRTPYGI
jgi:adenylosuccinate synthase